MWQMSAFVRSLLLQFEFGSSQLRAGVVSFTDSATVLSNLSSVSTSPLSGLDRLPWPHVYTSISSHVCERLSFPASCEHWPCTPLWACCADTCGLWRVWQWDQCGHCHAAGRRGAAGRASVPVCADRRCGPPPCIHTHVMCMCMCMCACACACACVHVHAHVHAHVQAHVHAKRCKSAGLSVPQFLSP